MAIGITYKQLEALLPCSSSLSNATKLLGGKWTKSITASEAKDAGISFNDLVWVASALASNDKEVERRLRLWMTDCAARVLSIYEDQFPNDKRVRNAIITARQFARGEIKAAAQDAARDDAQDAAWAAAQAGDAAWAAAQAGDAAWAAWYVARHASWAVVRVVVRAAAQDAAAWDVAAWDVARNAAWAAEETWQFNRLIAWFGDQEPTDWPLDKKEI